jgi:hypothetical protein
MKAKLNESGVINPLAVSLVTSIVLLVSSVGFGAWTFMSRQDYKNNSDEKAAQAAEVAALQTASDKDNEFIEREKEPLKQYETPADLGSIKFSYPKTWSGYVTISEDEGEFIFHPNVVNSNEDTAYALKVTVENSRYEDVVEDYDSLVEDGTARATVYKLSKVKSVTGVRVNGAIADNKQGSVVILPLRDKTIKITTESQSFVGDFNKYVLPSLSFSP